jgi:hypothetical protein
MGVLFSEGQKDVLKCVELVIVRVFGEESEQQFGVVAVVREGQVQNEGVAFQQGDGEDAVVVGERCVAEGSSGEVLELCRVEPK